MAYGEAVLIPVILHHLHGREGGQGIHLGRLDIRLEALIAVRGRKEYLIGAVVLLDEHRPSSAPVPRIDISHVGRLHQIIGKAIVTEEANIVGVIVNKLKDDASAICGF
jgi:hypothetical protein